MSFWKPNLETKGRVARGIAAAVLLIGTGLLIISGQYVPAGVMAFSGLFVAYEAASGWCVARACKIKTPL
jgi:hypothetical protein